MPNADLACAIAGFSLVGVAILMYGVRVLFRGTAKFARVEKDKGSALFGASLMQAGYWSLDYIGRGLSALGATANGISLGSLLLGVASGVALALGHYGVGALLAVISALGDTLDGIVARLQGTSSDAGEVLDAAVDRYEEFFFLGGIVVHLRQSAIGVSLVLFAILGSFMVSYASAKAEALRAEVPRGAMRRPERAAYLIVGAGLTPILAPFIASAVPGATWLLEAPVLGAIALVAVVANVSAVRRLGKLYASVGGPRSVATVAAVVPADSAKPALSEAVEAEAPRSGPRDAEAFVSADAGR